MDPVALLCGARGVVPVDPPEPAPAEHAAAGAGGRILAVLPTAEAERRYRPAERVRLDRHALVPGLVNLHTHASMTLMRGLADDLPLMTWLKDHVWPVWARNA